MVRAGTFLQRVTMKKIRAWPWETGALDDKIYALADNKGWFVWVGNIGVVRVSELLCKLGKSLVKYKRSKR